MKPRSWLLAALLLVSLEAYAAQSFQKRWRDADRNAGRGRREKARIALTKLAHDAVETEWEARALHSLALLDYEEGKFRTAVERWKMVIALPAVDTDTFFKALYNKSLCEYRSGSPTSALKTLQSIPRPSLAAQSETARRAYYELGVVLATASGRPEDRRQFESDALADLTGGNREYFKNTIDHPLREVAVASAPVVEAPAPVAQTESVSSATPSRNRWNATPRLGVGYLRYTQTNFSSVGQAAGILSVELEAQFGDHLRAEADGMMQFGASPVRYVEGGGSVGYGWGSPSGMRYVARLGFGYETLVRAAGTRFGFADVYGARARFDVMSGPWRGSVEAGPCSSDTSFMTFANYRLRGSVGRAWPWGSYTVGAGVEVIHLGLSVSGAKASATLAQLAASVML